MFLRVDRWNCLLILGYFSLQCVCVFTNLAVTCVVSHLVFKWKWMCWVIEEICVWGWGGSFLSLGLTTDGPSWTCLVLPSVGLNVSLCVCVISLLLLLLLLSVSKWSKEPPVRTSTLN